MIKSKNEEIKTLENKMKSYLLEQNEVNYIYLLQNIKSIEEKILKKFENHIVSIESELRQDSDHIKKNIEILKESMDVKSQITQIDYQKIGEKIDLESESREKIIQNLIQQMNDEFMKAHNLIANDTRQREENEDKILSALKDIMKKVKEELESEKIKREDFEENIFNILEETCNKLANNFSDN